MQIIRGSGHPIALDFQGFGALARPAEGSDGGSNPSRGTAQRDVFLCPTLDSNIRDGSAGRTPFGAHVYP